jgi:hypothetical protein
MKQYEKKEKTIMKLNNYQIYNYANSLQGIFENKDLYIPVKANFLMQKNIGVIAAAAQEIEKSRMEIAQHYGEIDESGRQYIIPAEKMEEANKELSDLFNIEQELDIRTFDIDALGSAEFSPAQMQAIMFMIED